MNFIHLRIVNSKFHLKSRYLDLQNYNYQASVLKTELTCTDYRIYIISLSRCTISFLNKDVIKMKASSGIQKSVDKQLSYF